MRIVRSTAVASAAVLATALALPNVAQSSGQAEPAALARAKQQLVALAELTPTSELDALQAPRRRSRIGSPAGPAIDPDHIANRLETAFALFPSGEALAGARLPRSRPTAPVELIALAYAEERPEAPRKAVAGVSAIEEMVARHAEDHDVPPALAQALVQVESGFNPKATGRNGEIGLLQIKPQTARAMGYKGSAKGLYDAETNLAVGMKYLAAARGRAEGDTCGTLLRYNAGLDAKRASKGSNKFCAKVKKVMAKRA